MKSCWVLGLIVPWLASCAEEKYVYRPAEQATATIGGLPAGRYAIPPERPVGTVLVASSGTAEVKFPHDVTTRMLSLRLVVANNSDAANWQVDTREQRAILVGSGESRPAFANSDRQGLPVIEVPPGQKRTIDLFYPLPAEAQKHGPVEFDLVWQVRTGERMVAERTPFDRMEVEPAYYGGNVGSTWAWGPYWWSDRFWPGPTYLSSPGFLYYPGPPTSVAPPVPVHRSELPMNTPPAGAFPAFQPGLPRSAPIMEPPRSMPGAPGMSAPSVPIHR